MSVYFIDLYAEHAIGGIVGLLFNALFADSELIALDGVNTSVPGGWLNRNWKQLYIQFAYICAVVGYSFVMTALLAKALDFIPCLSLRASPAEEALGMDDAQVCITSAGKLNWTLIICVCRLGNLQTTISKSGEIIPTGRPRTNTKVRTPARCPSLLETATLDQMCRFGIPRTANDLLAPARTIRGVRTAF